MNAQDLIKRALQEAAAAVHIEDVVTHKSESGKERRELTYPPDGSLTYELWPKGHKAKIIKIVAPEHNNRQGIALALLEKVFARAKGGQVRCDTIQASEGAKRSLARLMRDLSSKYRVHLVLPGA